MDLNQDSTSKNRPSASVAMKLFFALLFLALADALPKAQPGTISIFQDDAIPVVDNPDFEFFNLTTAVQASRSRDVSHEKRALQFEYLLVDVTFDGNIQANFQPFRVSGQVLVVSGIPSSGTVNGQNPYEVVISIGDPVVNPIAGSIRYVTNRYLYPLIGGARDATLVDFAFVSNTATGVEVIVDTSIAAANQLSTFNARSGITSNIYNPASGGFNLAFGDGAAVSGVVNIVGRGLISGGQAPYQAFISGAIIQKGTFTL